MTARASKPDGDRIASGSNLRLRGFFLTLLIGVVYVAGYSWYQRYQTARRHGYVDVDLRRLTDFAFDQTNPRVEDIPRHARDLDGKRVRLTGFMFGPEKTSDGGTKFHFVYDPNNSRRRGPPLIQERVVAHTKNKDVPIYDRNVLAEVIGTLYVRIVQDRDGEAISVFDLDVEQAMEIR